MTRTLLAELKSQLRTRWHHREHRTYIRRHSVTDGKTAVAKSVSKYGINFMSLNIKSLTINGNGGNLLGICQDPQKHYDEPRMFKSGTRSPKVVPFRCWKKNRKSTPSSSKSGGEIPDTQRLKTWIAKLALARRTTNSWFSRSKTIRNTTEQEGIIDTSATKMKRKLALKTLKVWGTRQGRKPY
ncbi:hypothetical protein SeMB42_g01774 [Synchytrium endobioticum]|uniref:Uncharacterized protein n=1 Tax=Synchytrium endobioticum TaxID=286115 RepID=A0A507DJP0_9FUNG|nr:hypothetical protein SeMB42_g01774 [Synchytrium endobioticum]